MSNAPKKRRGIGDFWDTVAPPAEELQTAPTEAPPPETELVRETASAPDERLRPGTARADTSRADTSRRAEGTRRGRPPTGVSKERMTVNLNPRSLQILESLRYQARMKGQRSATFSELLDEAVALLAKHHKLKLDE